MVGVGAIQVFGVAEKVSLLLSLCLKCVGQLLIVSLTKCSSLLLVNLCNNYNAKHCVTSSISNNNNNNDNWRSSSLSFIEAEISEEEEDEGDRNFSTINYQQQQEFMMNNINNNHDNSHSEENKENKEDSVYNEYSYNNTKTKRTRTIPDEINWVKVQPRARRLSISSSDISDSSSSTTSSINTTNKTNINKALPGLKRINISLDRAACHFPPSTQPNVYRNESIKQFVKFWKTRQEYCKERESRLRSHHYHMFVYDLLLKLTRAVSEIERHPKYYCEVPDETPRTGHQILNLAWKDSLEPVVIDLGQACGIVLKQEKILDDSTTGQVKHLIKVYKVSNAPVKFTPFRFKRTSTFSSTFRLHLNTNALKNSVEHECIYTAKWSNITGSLS